MELIQIILRDHTYRVRRRSSNYIYQPITSKLVNPVAICHSPVSTEKRMAYVSRNTTEILRGNVTIRLSRKSTNLCDVIGSFVSHNTNMPRNPQEDQFYFTANLSERKRWRMPDSNFGRVLRSASQRPHTAS